MNNIELEQIRRDAKKYLKYNDETLKSIGLLSDKKINAVKKQIEKIKDIKNNKSSKSAWSNNQIRKRVDQIFIDNPHLRKSKILGEGIGQGRVPKSQPPPQKPYFHQQGEVKKIMVSKGIKPKILFISDVKGWAWWIKSEYLKKYLSDEFDIDIKCVVGNGCIPVNRINQNIYDLYFTYGYSYIDFLYRVPKFKKATGITAHRARNVIFPKMKMAGHVHANSKMLLEELHNMGFKKAYYIPNGVDEELFKPIQPIKKEGKLIVGHVGKECVQKGQREFIIPAIQTTGVQSSTNLRTYKDKLPHTEMPRIYNEMDVFVVASIEDGTPNPALEAAACGRPIISNHIGNMPEFIKDGYNGFLVDRKIGEYVNKINYFKNNRSELIRMGENARKTVLEYWTWEKQAENYRNMFRNIFGRGK